MDERPMPPRIVRIATMMSIIVILGILLWLTFAPPAMYAQFKSWFQAAFDLVFGIIFTSCGLFYHSWFATVMGVHKAPAVLRFGPESARVGYIVIGLIFLTLGVAGFLLHIHA